jgi:DNA-binding NarL/FixJ family response regulator
MGKLLLVDDNEFHREGVRMFLAARGFDIQEAGDEETAQALAETHAFDAAVVDISLPPDAHTPVKSEDSYGIRLVQKLKQKFPSMGIVLFSAYEDRGADVFEMVREGIRGIAYKLKGSRPESLLQAIEDTIAGQVIIDPEVQTNRPALADELFNHLSDDEREWVRFAIESFSDLTPRETEIAHRVAASHNLQSIATVFTITPKTVENYVGKIYDKLGFSQIKAESAGLRKAVLLAKVCMILELRE